MAWVGRWVLFSLILKASWKGGSSTMLQHGQELKNDLGRSGVRGGPLEMPSPNLLETDPTRSLVLGGKDTVRDRFSFAEVSMQLGDDDHQCGGSLIAPDIILTAAHCVDWIKTAHIHRHDFNDAWDEYLTFDLHKKIVHPDFVEATFANDFLVLPLRGAVAGAQPVRLNDDANEPKPNDELSVLGWGATDVSTNPYHPVFATVLQLGRVDYIENSQCEASTVRGKKLYQGEIFPEMMCATNPGVDACAGDSGGPLVVRGAREGFDVQVGIVSWGRGCALYPGVYSRVSSGYSWIRKQVCWYSRDPPAYMKCSNPERDPKFLYESPTREPASAPIDDPKKEESLPGGNAEDVKTKPGNKEATTLSEPQQEMIDVMVEIQLDGRSEEISWFLAEDGRKVVEYEYGTYNLPNQIVTETISVKMGSSVLFAIIDRSGDGICCEHGKDGWYRISMSKEEGHVEVNKADGAFGRRSALKFTAGVTMSSDGTLLLVGDRPQPVSSLDETATRPKDLLTAGLEDYSKSAASVRETSVQSLIICSLILTSGWLV